MPEPLDDARGAAALDAYLGALAADPAAIPPPELDPALATIARVLEQHLGGPQPAAAAIPDPTFKVALRRRLEEGTARRDATTPHAHQASPVAPARDIARPLPSRGYPDGRGALLPSAFGEKRAGDVQGLMPPPARPAGPPTRRRRLWTAAATGAGWAGTVALILVVLLVASLLLRGLPDPSTPTQAGLGASPPGTPAATVPGTRAPIVVPTTRADSPGWQPVGTLSLPRSAHTATRLNNGRVLVTGGYTGGSGESHTAAAEIYDWATGRWSATAPMNVTRAGHQALLLDDGRVLVIGGINLRDEQQARRMGAEVYDPARGTWLLTASLPLGANPSVLTRLADGRVLAVSGTDATEGNRVTAMIYDPRADIWSLAGHPGLLGVAVTLTSGKVLLLDEAGEQGRETTRALLYDPATGDWTPTTPLPGSRTGFVATMLGDGTVLVVGGVSLTKGTGGATSAIPLVTTAIYDPTNGRWTDGPPMSRARVDLAAVTLADGRFLVVGSDAQFGASGERTTTAELYDSQRGRWSSGGALATGRARFALAPLADGRAIAVGGDDGRASGSDNRAVLPPYFASTELFTPPPKAQTSPAFPSSRPTATPTAISPAGGIWQPAAPLAEARERHAAVALRDGTVLVIGGWDGNRALSSAERYDPATNRWTPAAPLATSRADHTATLLRDGRVLVVGGYTDGGGEGAWLATTEIYDPQADRWTPGAPLTSPRTGHEAVRIYNASASPGAFIAANDHVLVAGGRHAKGPLADAERYDPSADRWTPAGALATPRLDFTATALVNGHVLVAGGDDGQGTTLASAERYDPQTNTWRPAAPMGTPRAGHAATELNFGQIVAIGGIRQEGGNGIILASTERYDFSSDRWVPTADLAVGRYQPLAVGFGASILVVGATYSTGDSATAERYDVATNRWASAGRATSPHPHGTATALPDGRVLVVGGAVYSGNSVTMLATVDLYQPAPAQPGPSMPIRPTPATPSSRPAGIVPSRRSAVRD
jgi:large repetitive protein